MWCINASDGRGVMGKLWVNRSRKTLQCYTTNGISTGLAIFVAREYLAVRDANLGSTYTRSGREGFADLACV